MLNEVHLDIVFVFLSSRSLEERDMDPFPGQMSTLSLLDKNLTSIPWNTAIKKLSGQITIIPKPELRRF